MPQSYNRWLRNTCGCWQNATHPWIETSQDIQRCPMFPGTTSIPGPLHARYKRIHNPTIRLCKEWPSIWMDALVRKVFWKHQNTSVQGSNIAALLTMITLILSGLLPMAPKQEWEPSMVKDPTGRHVNQLGSCPRNSVMHNSITEHTSTRWLLCLKPSWSGRTNY